jgi:hypothetical protein
MLTVAPGTTAPLGSETVPESGCQSLARRLNGPMARTAATVRRRISKEEDRKSRVMDQPVLFSYESENHFQHRLTKQLEQ